MHVFRNLLMSHGMKLQNLLNLYPRISTDILGQPCLNWAVNANVSCLAHLFGWCCLREHCVDRFELALFLGEVSRKDVGNGMVSKYKNWVSVQVPGVIPLPRVRPIVHGTGGALFCSKACSQRGRAKPSEVKDFANQSWDFTVRTPVPCAPNSKHL